MKKKAQIALFLILGFVILVGMGFIYFISGNISSEKAKTEVEKIEKIAFSSENIKNFLELCFKNLAVEGIDYTSLRGGYFILPKKSYDEGILKTAFYFYEDYSLFPEINAIENSISDYLKTYANYCFDDLKNIWGFPDVNYKIENVSTRILKNNVIMTILAPTNIKFESNNLEINEYKVELNNNRLYDVYNYRGL